MKVTTVMTFDEYRDRMRVGHNCANIYRCREGYMVLGYHDDDSDGRAIDLLLRDGLKLYLRQKSEMPSEVPVSHGTIMGVNSVVKQSGWSMSGWPDVVREIDEGLLCERPEGFDWTVPHEPRPTGSGWDKLPYDLLIDMPWVLEIEREE